MARKGRPRKPRERGDTIKTSRTYPGPETPVETIQVVTPAPESGDSRAHVITVTRSAGVGPRGPYEHVCGRTDGLVTYERLWAGDEIAAAALFMTEARAYLGDRVTA